jgi:ubiquinone/menaquinone biosynthesis C-methylase UbiE
MIEAQNSEKEREFFDRFAEAGEYDVFTEAGYRRLLQRLVSLAGPERLKAGCKVVDLGCGSGAVIQRLSSQCEADCVGVDISPKLIEIASKKYPAVEFRVGNILTLDDADETYDVVLYSGVLHHFPEMDPVLCEGFRVLKKGGCLLAFDPNQSNPAMWLYRDPRSPMFSPVGKTENEILLESKDMSQRLARAGFRNIKMRALGGITFRYLESKTASKILPIYNLFETLFGWSPLASRFGSFLISYGEK